MRCLTGANLLRARVEEQGLVNGVMRCLLCGLFPLFCVHSCSLLILPLASRGPFFASLALLLHSGFAIIPTVKELLHLRQAGASGLPHRHRRFHTCRSCQSPVDRPSSGFCYLLSSASAHR